MMLSPFPSKLVLASHNQGKIKEFQTLFAPYRVEVVAQTNFGINEAEEPFITFVENALAKARHASQLSKLPAIADDSGICSLALSHLPGVHSARLAGKRNSSATDNNQKLSEMLANELDKSVYYYCCLVFITHKEDPTPIIAEGKWFGTWSFTPRGENGFGYDPHFYLPEQSLTVAQLSIEQKNQQSHRARAFSDLINQLKQSYELPAL